jgi:hypothetical protein
MELFTAMVAILAIKAVVAFVRLLRQNASSTKPESLCAFCSFAHVQYGANGSRAISCTFGGGVRAMKLDVLYCTDYSSRNTPARVVRLGFVNSIEPVDSSAVASAPGR